MRPRFDFPHILLLQVFLGFALCLPKAMAASGDPGVFLSCQVVYNQCSNGGASIYLHNDSVVKYRITILKQNVNDQNIKYVIEPRGKPVWIGCNNDGYSYSINEITKLP